jgi:hypothetical protein
MIAINNFAVQIRRFATDLNVARVEGSLFVISVTQCFNSH